MPERARRCRSRSPLSVRAGRADFADTLVIGTMMAAAVACYAWLIEAMAGGS